MNKNANLHPLLIREAVIKACRAFFDERGFHEVITPVLNKALPLEPNIYSFETTWSAANPSTLQLHSVQAGQRRLYLPTSPESNLKKLLAQGIGDCYSIGHTFRNLESSGSRHNPEFLMMEWYREDAEYTEIMADVKALIKFVRRWVCRSVGDLVSRQLESTLNDHTSNRVTQLPRHGQTEKRANEKTVQHIEYQGKTLDLSKWQTLSLENLFLEYAGIRLEEVVVSDGLWVVAKEKGYGVEGATWSQLFDQIFLNEIEPHVPFEPFFLVDFPARLSPLCAVNREKPYLAERFEVYIAGMELGNGNTEKLDASEVKRAFEQEMENRKLESLDTHPYDEEFLQALHILSKSGKKYAGIGLGIDRLAMIFADEEHIPCVL